MEWILVDRVSGGIGRVRERGLSMGIGREVDKAVRLALLRKKLKEATIINSQEGIRKISKAVFISTMGREILDDWTD